MEVAICLSGAMSKCKSSFSKKGDLYIDAPYIDYNLCYESTKKHILDCNNCNFDFYIHSWNVDLKKEIDYLYKPILSLFEDNSKYNNEISSKIRNAYDFSGVSKSLSMKKSIELLESSKKTYDLVMIYRPDVLLLKNINFHMYEKDKIYVNAMGGTCQADFHFIMNYNNALRFKLLYDSIDQGNEHRTHFWVNNYVKNYMKLSLVEDNIEAGKDQEVLRKIVSGENSNIKLGEVNMKLSSNNAYTNMQKKYYDSTADIMAIENHRGHDSNPDYYGLLLSDITHNPKKWEDKNAFDFGFGIGRNIDNLLRLSKWNMVDGADISQENMVRAEKFLLDCNYKDRFNLYVTDGISLNNVPSDTYDFVMSTIVLQHIPVYDIRKNLFKEIYRIMKSDALFSFQMAQYNNPNHNHSKYYDNFWGAQKTNGGQDVSVDNVNDLIKDLCDIGYRNIECEIKPEWDANNRCYVTSNSKWIFIKANK